MTKSADPRITTRVGVHEAKTRLSELLRVVGSGQEVEILRNGEPVARLVPAAPRSLREFGFDRGVFHVPKGFDEELPTEIIDTFDQ